jgi:hypothetical protein
MPTTESPLFTYAILSDTHMRPPEGDESSPWLVNNKANGRARYVAERLRQEAPAFAIHLGDMVHPVPQLPSYGSAAKAALELFSSLEFPIHYIPGNHDVGDKPLAGLPAEPVSEEAVDIYGRYFGETFFQFTHADCRFILLNAEIINSGLPSEYRQRRFLEQILGSPDPSERRFVFIHYPPFLLRPDEVSNYDNIDQPGRSWLLDLLQSGDVETLFSGHVHHFFNHRHHGTEIFTLPAVCFTRQDYSELFRAAPEAAAEHGRDDADKLGFCLVDVFADRQIVRIERTRGRQLEPGERLRDGRKMVRAHHPKDAMAAPLGLHMRHPWAEIVDLPYNPLDEFVRKRVRNDYPIMALLELGTRALRLPVSDLMEREPRGRMEVMAANGVRFTVFLFNRPTPPVLEALQAHGDLVDCIELVYDWRNCAELGEIVGQLKARIDVPVHVSRVESGREQKLRGDHDPKSTKFSHFVSTGFGADEWDRIDAFRTDSAGADAIDGYGFRVGHGLDPCAQIAAVERGARDRDLQASVYVKLASDNPATAVDDDRAIANRVALTIIAAYAAPAVQVFLDTFCDIDRGYFPRHGLYDRRYNPRPASFVYRHLQTLLADHPGDTNIEDRFEHADGWIHRFTTGGQPLSLLLPNTRALKKNCYCEFAEHALTAVDPVKWVDLVEGEVFDHAPGESVKYIARALKGAHQVVLMGDRQ